MSVNIKQQKIFKRICLSSLGILELVGQVRFGSLSITILSVKSFIFFFFFFILKYTKECRFAYDLIEKTRKLILL